MIPTLLTIWFFVTLAISAAIIAACALASDEPPAPERNPFRSPEPPECGRLQMVGICPDCCEAMMECSCNPFRRAAEGEIQPTGGDTTRPTLKSPSAAQFL